MDYSILRPAGFLASMEGSGEDKQPKQPDRGASHVGLWQRSYRRLRFLQHVALLVLQGEPERMPAMTRRRTFFLIGLVTLRPFSRWSFKPQAI